MKGPSWRQMIPDSTSGFSQWLHGGFSPNCHGAVIKSPQRAAMLSPVSTILKFNFSLTILP